MATKILWMLLVPALCQASFFRRIRQVRKCGSNKFECTSGTCIDSRKICDGTNDCSDASDETQTLCLNTYVPALTNFISKEILPLVETCPKGTFQCRVGGCLDLKVKCNGKEECLDGSDENLPECPRTGCGNDEFRCQNKQCVPKSKHCNGVKECSDGSDENGCPPTVVSSPTNCILPEFPEHGTYTFFFCNDQPVPGKKIPGNCLLHFSCNEEFVLSDQKPLACKESGEWSSPVPKCEPKTCREIPTTSVNITCKNSLNIPCNMRLPIGSTVELKCKPFFYSEINFQRITCDAKGFWSENPLSCKEECGSPIPQGTPLSSNGVPTEIRLFPWHVGIYKKKEDNFEQICGGSLIGTKHVLTVAHCFWNKTEAIPESFFRIAAGKYHRDINTVDPNQQIRDVQKLWVHKDYRGEPGSYEADIAIVVVSVPFDISPVVQPVCIDWNRNHEMAPGDSGTVVGWGITEKEVTSDVLLRIDVPFVERYTCLRNAPSDFQRYILRDKICVGDLSKGQTVCQGDSGGGFCYETELNPLGESRKRFVIKGLVSIGVNKKPNSCNTNNYAVFTEVSSYLQWIMEKSQI